MLQRNTGTAVTKKHWHSDYKETSAQLLQRLNTSTEVTKKHWHGDLLGKRSFVVEVGEDESDDGEGLPKAHIVGQNAALMNNIRKRFTFLFDQ